MDMKKRALSYIDGHADVFTALSDEIWGYAELSLKERRSAAAFARALEAAGFAVETQVCGIETAVAGQYGSGRPVIGFLAEYDALSGLSQRANTAERAPEAGMADGHGCGHNLLGAGAFAAACAVKQYLADSGLPGTVILYGCPGEEGGAAKAFMAKAGLFRTLDAALTWHPADVNEVAAGSCLACIQTEYRFTGLAAHAAGCPELGRSALDAAELMNIGVQFLREHCPSTARIHYAFTDGGGLSPNVVQPTAGVLYMVRDVSVKSALLLQKRVDDIAAGAALMSGVTLEKRFIDGCSELVPNHALESLLYQNFEAEQLPSYSEEDWAFARALHETYAAQVAGQPVSHAPDEAVQAAVKRLSENGARALNDFLMPLCHGMGCEPGSTDVGDVSWLTPTAQVHTVTAPSLCPGHSWQNVAAGKSALAHKGMLLAARVLAGAAIDMLDEPALLDVIRAEFTERTAGGWTSPIPDGAEPAAV